MPSSLDEYPIHQAPLSMRYFATSDRNVYDRCIMHLLDRSGEVQLAAGLGVYPHVGVIDAYVTLRQGRTMVAVRASHPLGDDRMTQQVGPIRIDVDEPLRRVRLRCDADEHGLGVDLVFEGSMPATDEPQHQRRRGNHLIIDGCRFVQTGTWSGEIRAGGERVTVTPEAFPGARDRSWGIRPTGDVDAPGRWAHDPGFGSWWCWVPLRFDDFSLMFVLEEDARGFRTINDAVRIWPEATGRPVEQLGWPDVDISYRSGSRYPTRATFALRGRDGRPLTLDVEPLGPMPLVLGCGYAFGRDEWSHGKWMGENWLETVRYDLDDPATAQKAAWSMIDHAARATLRDADGREHTGYGIFEHGVFGIHEPSGLSSMTDVAP